MKRGMTHAARAELADAIRSRYSATVGKDKRKILHESTGQQCAQVGR
jgi:hypothetical protein